MYGGRTSSLAEAKQDDIVDRHKKEQLWTPLTPPRTLTRPPLDGKQAKKTRPPQFSTEKVDTV